MSRKPRAFEHRTMATGPRRARERAEMYRHFIPGWPALAESFEREAERLEKERGKK